MTTDKFGLTYSNQPVFVLSISGAKISSVIHSNKLYKRKPGSISTNKVDVRNLSGINLPIDDIVLILIELLDRFSTDKSLFLDILITIEHSINEDVVSQCITCLFVSLREANIPLKNYIICTSVSLLSEDGCEKISVNSHDTNSNNTIVLDRCYIGTSFDTGALLYIYCTNYSNKFNQFIKIGFEASTSLGYGLRKLIKL